MNFDLSSIFLRCCLVALVFSAHVHVASGETDGLGLRQAFLEEVDRRLDVPDTDQDAYVGLLTESLATAGLSGLQSQYLVLADRSPAVQAVFLYWLSPGGKWYFIGASPASTGQTGRRGYFLTPTGVFAHIFANPDFRAQGTRNAKGILGYGQKGMRVYDFGWAIAERGWGVRSQGIIRLQMHATDAELLEPSLGIARSKGCIRIPATLNRFIDRHGLLDADYQRAAAEGHRLWVWRLDRRPTPWPGQYLVVVDSRRVTRPDWSPAPRRR